MPSANDGMQFGGGMGMRQHNAALSAKPAAKPVDQADGGGGQKPLAENPQAMQLVDQLKQMGYSGDEVAQAMDGGEKEQSQSGGQEATQAAPMQIPGLS